MVKYRSLKEKGKDAPERVSLPGIKYRPIEEVTKKYTPKKATIASFEDEVVNEFGLDMEWEKKQEAREKAMKLPKIDLEKIRNASPNYNQFSEPLSQAEVSKNNRQAHIDAGLSVNRTQDEINKEKYANANIFEKMGMKIKAEQDKGHKATLSGTPAEYKQQETARDNRYMTDGNIKPQVKYKSPSLTGKASLGVKEPNKSTTPGEDTDIRFRKDRAESLLQGVKDIPRNLSAGVIQALDTGAELITGGQHNNAYKPRTEEDWNKMNATNDNPNKPKTYDEYLAHIDKLNQGVAEQKGTVERIASKVTEDTTFVEKALRAAALNLPGSAVLAGMGGISAGVAQGLTKNKIIIEGARNLPLFSSGLNGGLEQADQLGLTGAKKYTYGVASGLIETATERMSMVGFEGKLMGATTKGAVGGFKETIRGIIEEPATEMLNSLSQQVLTGGYTNFEDFELDIEEIALSGVSSMIMSGVNVSGTFKNGIKYRTVGVENGMVIVETEDGRTQPLAPEIVAKHQLEMTRPEYDNVKKAYKKQNMAEMFEQYSSDETETETTPTMPTELTTTPQEALEPETDISTTDETETVTEPLIEQKKDAMKNVGYHYGDLGKAEFLESTEPTRGTGHFGTGTYFVGDADTVQSTGIKNRPVNEVDFTNYNLYKVKSKAEGYKLHDTLKDLNGVTTWKMPNDVIDSIVNGEGYEGEEYGRAPQYLESFIENAEIFGMTKEQAITKVKELTKYVIENQPNAKKNKKQFDSPSTMLMKELGYEGIDVRGIKGLDDEQYGSVIYDLKSETPQATREVAKPKVSAPKINDGKTITAQNMDTRLKYEDKLDAMIKNKLIDSKAKRVTAEKLNRQIVGLSGKDRSEEFKKVEVPKIKTKETTPTEQIMDSDGKIYANNMDFSAEANPYIEAEEVETVSQAIPTFDLLDGYKESKTKKTLLESDASPRFKEAIKDEDFFYETVTIKGEVMKSKEQVTGKIESELVRIETMKKEGKVFEASDGTDIIALKEAIDEIWNKTGDAYWEGYAKRIAKMYKEVYSNAGQLLAMGKANKKSSPKMTIISMELDVEEGMTTAQKTNAENVERKAGTVIDKIPETNGKVQLDQAQTDDFVKLIMERFPKLKKKWGREWTKRLLEGTATKAEILDSIYTASGVPHLGADTKLDILNNLEAMEKLEEGSPEYNIHNNEVKSIIRRSRGINIWTKISAIQTYAMLGNVKTGLKNELGNWMGFSMGQFDARYAEKADKSYAKVTGVRTVAEKGNLGVYGKGYKEGVKLSVADLKNRTDSRTSASKYFDDKQGKIFKHEAGGYARILVDLVTGENVVEASKQFAQHTAAKAENLTKFIVDDRRHGYARYEMAKAAIESTDTQIKELNKTLPKDEQIVFSKEELLANIEKEVAYYAFNNRTEGAKILTSAVKALNKFSTFGATTEFGLGTLVAKFTQTPMNIIAFTGDHLGYDYAKSKIAYNKDYKELKKTLPKLEAKKEALTQNQRELAISKGKALTGATFIMTGAMLSALGAITPDREDEEENMLLEAQGYESGYFNLSGLVRTLLGGGSDEKVYDYGNGDIQDGDTLTSINQLVPGGAFLLLGARLFDTLTNEETDKSLSGILGGTVKSIVDSSTDLVDLPFNRTASMIINEFKYAKSSGDATEALVSIGNKLLGSAITSFMPAVGKQTAQLLDPYAKTYSKDSGEAVKQQIMAAIPTMRDDVPYGFSINGEPVRYSGEKNAIEALWSAYVAPYYKSTVTYDPKTVNLTKKVDKKEVAPPKLAPNKVTYTRTDYELSKEERQDFQKVYWEAYKQTGDIDSAYNKAKIDYLKKNKIPYRLNEDGILIKLK